VGDAPTALRAPRSLQVTRPVGGAVREVRDLPLEGKPLDLLEAVDLAEARQHDLDVEHRLRARLAQLFPLVLGLSRPRLRDAFVFVVLATKPSRELIGSAAPADIAQLQFRASSPIMALVLTLVAVPLSRLRPRQGRYARVGFAIVVYFVYSQLLYAAKAWLEKGDLSPSIGVWWVHLAALALGLYLVGREGRAV